MIREGTLINDTKTEKMDVRFGLEEYYGGLHCGEGMDVEIDGEWVPTRIEMGCSDGQWYLVGKKTDELQGLKVRL